MWGENGQAGGGFFNSPNQYGGVNTPSNKGKSSKTGTRYSRTAPIVISQALKCSDDGLKIWGSEIQIVCIVARVLDIKVESTKIIYSIEDMTGRMKAMFWTGQDATDGDDDTSIPNVMVNTYVQLYGNIKTNKSKKVMSVFKIVNINDINAITNHYLQCMHNRIVMEAKSKKVDMSTDVEMSSHSAVPSNSMITNMDMGGATAGLNPRQLMVFNLIRTAKLEEGTSKEDMQVRLKDKMSKVELDKILEWMCGEGHIYSTIDEDHFRATDAS
ncbi:replication protein A2 [Arctopsyche grandis]|uniref:replication protein A2 n=1 Tax=Arctopsyche grandis TaxID=121162 RepID=UPI00406D907E